MKFARPSIAVGALALAMIFTGAGAFTSSPASAAVSCVRSLYVDPAGKDSASGTSPSTAWKTIAKVSASTIAPGTCVLLKGGATFSGTLTLSTGDANSAALPVTVTSYGTGAATVSAGANRGILIYDTGGVTVTNLIVKGSGATRNHSNGIDIYNDTPGAVKYKGVTISYVDVSGFKESGISIAGAPTDGSKSGFSDVVIRNVAAHDNGDAGIQSYGNFSATATTYAHSNITVSNTSAYGNLGISGKGAPSGSGIVLGDVDGALIQYSTASNNGAKNNYAHGGPVGIWTWDSNNVVIKHNESYANKSLTIDGDGFDLDGGVTNSVMEYNYSHDNDGPGFLVYEYAGARPQNNNVVRYNISQNDARKTAGAIAVGAATGVSADKVDFYDNTVFVSPSATNPTTAALRVWNGTQNARFMNNIFMTSGGSVLASIERNTSTTFSGDDWYSSGAPFKVLVGGTQFDDSSATVYSSYGAWTSATGAEHSGSSGSAINPQLAAAGSGGTVGDTTQLASLNAYRLKPTSTLGAAGVNLSSLGVNSGGVDFYGGVAPFGDHYAIGAHQPQTG